jgi:hypothetical protein
MERYTKYIIIILVLLGLLFMTNHSLKNKEGFSSLTDNCPNVLIQKDSAYYLYNSKRAKVPGVNPLRFNNLEEYNEFIEWQRSQGIRCPILYLQKSYDTQGDEGYTVRPDPTDLQGGLPTKTLNYGPSPKPVDMPTPVELSLGELKMPPETKLIDAGRNDPPYNVNSYPGFDQQNQYIGLNTPLDKMYNENPGGVSPNPMDTNWGGHKYTQGLVDSGYYKDNEVAIRIAT